MMKNDIYSQVAKYKLHENVEKGRDREKVY
jgi:hypothetical protein